MASAKKRVKRKRKTSSKSGSSKGTPTASSSISSSVGVGASSSAGGGVMQGIRSGFQRAAGVGEQTEKEKPSTVSNVLWTVVLLGAVAFLLYRWYG